MPSILINIFVTIFGTGLGFLGALFLYRRKIKFDEKGKERETINQYISRLKYFNLLLKSILKNTQRQADNYQKLAERIEKTPHERHLVGLIVFKDIKRIHQMDSEEVFRAYLSVFSDCDDTIMKYKEIYSNIDFIEEALKQKENAQEKHIMFTHEDQKRVKEIIDGLAEDLRSILYSIRASYQDSSTYETQPIVIDFTNLINEYLSIVKNKGKFFDFEKEFSEPLRKLIIEKYSDQGFSNFLLVKSRQASSILKHIRFNSLEYSKDLISLKENLNNSFNKLDCSAKMIDQAVKAYYEKAPNK